MLLYIACAMQIAHLGQIGETGLFQVQYIAMLGAFYALYAREDYALLACFLAGLAYQLLSGNHVLGWDALVLSFAGWMIMKARSAMFQEHALSQAIVGGIVTGIFLFGSVYIPRLIHPANPKYPGLWHAWWMLVTGAAYTALIMPIFCWILLRWRRALGFEDRRLRPYAH